MTCVRLCAHVTGAVLVQVLCHVTTRLQRLHAADLVHRDLKPGNVLWRPQHLEWTLIDFGCAAHILSLIHI